MSDRGVKDLAQYRLTKAKEMLNASLRDDQQRDYASANNRAYYCIFHSMRALLALNGEE